jgi:preprotein translocase SecE subunit
MANGSAAKAVSKPKTDGFIARAIRFVKESYVETWHKSAWPTWAELRSFTLVVIFAVLVVAIWIGGIDFILTKITNSISGGSMTP